MKLLLHTCCAPCLSGSRIPFQEEGYDITAYWYNPNIHPYKEHERRFQTLQRYLYLDPMELIADVEYDQLEFISGQINVARNADSQMKGKSMNDEQKKARCRFCYLSRLEKCASMAKEKGFDSFSTTMLLSKHQNHKRIMNLAEEISRKRGIDFVYKDLSKNWKASIEISKYHSLYRQPYCGCVFSEYERYSSE